MTSPPLKRNPNNLWCYRFLIIFIISLGEVQKEILLQCDECDKKCKTVLQLKKHKDYHKYYLNGPQIFCEKCNKNIPEKLFGRHVHTVHPDDPEMKDILEKAC